MISRKFHNHQITPDDINFINDVYVEDQQAVMNDATSKTKSMLHNDNSMSNITGIQNQIFSTDGLNTNSNYPVQVLSAEHGTDMDGFVFNPNKDIGARPISSGN